MRFKIKALRGSAGSTKAKLFETDAELELHANSVHPSIRLIGGPTGYESFNIESFLATVQRQRERGNYDPATALCWEACMGTPGLYDRMIVPHDQMKAAFEAFGIVVPT